jgi:hypothetical protein
LTELDAWEPGGTLMGACGQASEVGGDGRSSPLGIPRPNGAHETKEMSHGIENQQ